MPHRNGFHDPRKDDRIRNHSAPIVNERIDQLTEERLAESIAGGRDAMLARIHEIDREWDIDRALIANFAITGALTYFLGRKYDRKFMVFFGAQQLFLLMHAVVGWCPPVSLFRRLGFRTAKEISAERDALVRKIDARAARRSK